MTTATASDPTGLDGRDPARNPVRDAVHVRAIVAAGESWTVIGAALGVTRPAAQQRFSRE